MKTKGSTRKGSARKAFNTASVPGRDMRVLREYTDVLTGARLACVEIPSRYAGKHGLKAGPVFLTGWMPGGSVRIHNGFICRSREAAESRFSTLAKSPAPPVTPAFQRDWQRQRVYDWEAKNTDRGRHRLTLDQMAHLIGQVSQDFGVKPPKFRFVKTPPKEGEQIYSYYHADTHTIEMRDNALSTLVHELAHMLDHKLNGNPGPVWHGPGFVRTLVQLSFRYHWRDIWKMEHSLKKSGVMAAPLDALPVLKARLDHLHNGVPSYAQMKVIPILK